MKLSHFFIDRPIFASVVWIIVVIIGALSYFNLPIEQYPQVVPPTVVVTANYPGANADVVAKTVATPLEQEINGVENMLYMSSQSTNDGTVTITITFKIGTNLDTAQVLVQNRVSIAEPRLPEEVRRRGITTRKNSPDLMLVINMYSPDGRFDQTFIANYATLQLKDRLARITGVGDIRVFGASEYSMRIWLDPDKIASLNMTAGDVIDALRNNNIQVASGTLGQQPTAQQPPTELNVQTQGRLVSPEQFAEIVVKTSEAGKTVKIKDIGRVELGADSYNTQGYLGDKNAVALPIFQRPGTNALETAEEIQQVMREMVQHFPEGLEYQIVYNPTEFIAESIKAVFLTILEAIVLVVLVIILFLQSWRAAIIPIVAIPISLIGTFIVMSAFGLSLNNLTLFGLVLSIGIVVDDAIVVVENMQRLIIEQGMDRKLAAKQTMNEVGGALIAMGLVLVAVFLPVTFIEGIAGRFFQQFGAVVAVATLISVAVSLTLSPAMAARLLTDASTTSWHGFDKLMQWLSQSYGRLTARLVRMGALMMLLYLGLMSLTGVGFNSVATGFIPAQDQGYFIVGVQLPPGASLDRTNAVISEAVEKLLQIEGVSNAVGFAGFNGATFTNATNAGAIFPVLDDFHIRRDKGITYQSLLTQLRQAMATVKDGYLIVIPPPPVRGIGRGGGFKMMVQDTGGLGAETLNQYVWTLAGAANQEPAVTQVFSFYETRTPQLYLDIDRERTERLGVPLDRVFEALNVYLGSSYVNDFNYLGRTYRVTAQADSDYRMTADDIARLWVRNEQGNMVPLGTLAVFEDRSGPSRQPRYNLYPAAELQGDTAPGYSSGQALSTMETLAAKLLPPGLGFEWTELAYQEKQSGNSGMVAFTMAVIFVFLLLAALYESWVLPLAIILIVPMCLLSAISGLWWLGMDNNILTQIGFVTLIGLACKNAILIVEFAKQAEDDDGKPPWEAAVTAAKIRLRPILMTSFAFILGVVPLAIATGAGAEMRQALGIAVFFGMLGVTGFGLIFTPVFYVLCRKLKISTFKKTQ